MMDDDTAIILERIPYGSLAREELSASSPSIMHIPGDDSKYYDIFLTSEELAKKYP